MAGTWLLAHPTTPSFCLSSAHFFITLCTHLGLPHPIIAHLSQCHYGHTIDNLGTHFFWCPYRSEWTTTHNTLQDIVAAIPLEMEHMFRNRSPTFSLATPNNEWISLSPKTTSKL
jgi:hypothetical protein